MTFSPSMLEAKCDLVWQCLCGEHEQDHTLFSFDPRVFHVK